MRVLLLSAVVVATLDITISTVSATARNHTSATYLSNSLLNSLLLAAGYSDTCVAAALDTCGPAALAPVEHQLPPILEGARALLQEVRHVVSQYENRLRNCKDLLETGDSGKGIRQVYPYTGQPYRRATVYCDHTIDGGGWTVIQRRSNGSVREDFSRSSVEYKLGFGNMENEFWLGLDLIHELTSTVLQELRIDMADYEGGERLAKYGFFHVGSSDTNYRMDVGSYIGDAGDSLTTEGHRFPFSAEDSNHPGNKYSCAVRLKGGWWFGNCQSSNLNGFHHEGVSRTGDGIFWKSWRGKTYSLRYVTMMIRPAK